jgi:hypothetical protein
VLTAQVLAVAVDVLAGLKSVSTQCWRRHISVGGDYAGETGGCTCLVQPLPLILSDSQWWLYKC